jgi:hypothetical protein
MSRLDELPPDQRAALSLLLRQRKSYADVAAILGVSERAVHDRAHAALAVLAPLQARALTPEQREEVGEHLLGAQATVAERLRTRTLLGSSPAARDWAQALSAELAQLAGTALPAIPPAVPTGATAAPMRSAPAAAAAAISPGERLRVAAEDVPIESEAAGSSGGSPSGSRVGGMILLAVIVIGVIGVIVAIAVLNGGSSGKSSTSAKTGTTAKASGPTVNARITLRSPSGASHGEGQLDVLSEGAKRAFYVLAQHLPPTHGFFYALWLYNSVSSHEPLSRGPAVGASGRMEGGALLPANAGEFHEVLLTRETKPHPTHPGLVILRGRFTLG